MPKKIKFERSFESDYKKMAKRRFDEAALFEVIELLQSEQNLPVRCRPHKLTGKYNGLWECHVRNDLLLIWLETVDSIILMRLGSHVDLFDK